MKIENNKSNVYVFKSYLLVSNIICFFLVCLASKLFFYDHDMKKSVICFIISLIFIYLTTLYCKITINLNTGLIFCTYFKFFKLQKNKFEINNINNITANIDYIKYKGKTTPKFSLTILTNSPDNKRVTFYLATTKDQLDKSVELMNSLIEQYKQNYDKKA